MSSQLPPNATPQEVALAEAIGRVGDVPVPNGSLWDPATCPAALLPWLAWALSVDVWVADWSDDIKRAVIAESLLLHRRKGTPWAVERALVVAGAPNALVQEWFEYGGQPGYFKVMIDIQGQDISNALEARLLATVNGFKNVRSWLDLLEYSLSAMGAVPSLALGLQSSEIVTIYPWEAGAGNGLTLQVANGPGTYEPLLDADGQALVVQAAV